MALLQLLPQGLDDTAPLPPAPVDEMFPSRHETSATADVESPSRAAGGFPTLGGGTGWGTGWGTGSCARADMRRRDRVAVGDASGRSEGG